MRYINFEEADQGVLPDELFMREALREARIALELDEVPIGAVIVHGGRIIARGHNLTERLNDVTAHAEMQAFTAAANFIGGKYLRDCTLYVTVEPCVMCAGAAYWTQLKRVVFGATDSKRGYSQFGAGAGAGGGTGGSGGAAGGGSAGGPHSPLLHPKTEVLSGVLEAECAELIQSFFRNKRQS